MANGKPIERWQARKIKDALYPLQNYLVRLRDRMPHAGFPQNDPLFQLVCKAFDAVTALMVELHYRSCEGGVG